MPVAVTEKVAALPERTVNEAGGVVIVGREPMVRVAAALVTVATELVTRTVYKPAFALWTLPIVRLELVAPATASPSRNHWKVRGSGLFATTVKVAALPARTVNEAGCVAIVGGLPMESAAPTLAAVPNVLVTRTV